MFSVLVLGTILCLLLPPIQSDVIDPISRCGGVGTFRELRINECISTCHFYPGRVYNCELDFMPSSAAPSLTLLVEICMDAGFCMQIINAELSNSSVQPGFVYTSKYAVVPNDILAGSAVDFRASILHTDNRLVEVCVSATIVVLFPPTPPPLQKLL